eukprot:CAMPEP_0183522060 /NCGR_PEP_ID=MMETSP0371-20130417/18147_1 /TAXON_ID=268820 /ORGANISM="Peridinium aciculiferum, Strain PAER-2" /LENGTH=140 /DNA_ID=CAMNT_0025720749 /DNA_START=782 /DNA_END=1205 /DNA_ORIENTATION=+
MTSDVRKSAEEKKRGEVRGAAVLEVRWMRNAEARAVIDEMKQDIFKMSVALEGCVKTSSANELRRMSLGALETKIIRIILQAACERASLGGVRAGSGGYGDYKEVYFAKLTEQAERHDEMADHMENDSKFGGELSVEERN